LIIKIIIIRIVVEIIASFYVDHVTTRKILLGLVYNQEYDKDTGKLLGLSSYNFQKLRGYCKLGNDTFRTNVKPLEKNGLVELVPVTSIKIGFKKKIARSNKKPYKITPLGHLALLKSIEPKHFRKMPDDQFTFIPHINTHFLDMKTIAKDSKNRIWKIL